MFRCLSLPVQRLQRAAQTADSRQHTNGHAHDYDPSAQLKLTAQPDRTYDTHHRRNHNRQPKLGQPDQMAGGIV